MKQHLLVCGNEKYPLGYAPGRQMLAPMAEQRNIIEQLKNNRDGLPTLRSSKRFKAYSNIESTIARSCSSG